MDADYQGQWRSVRLTPETRVVHTIRADAMRGALTALAIALASGEVGNAAVVTLGLKNRSRAASGWHDSQRLQHSGPEGGAIQQQVTGAFDVHSLTDDELEVLEGVFWSAVEREGRALTKRLTATC